jgi:hypothetical protein
MADDDVIARLDALSPSQLDDADFADDALVAVARSATAPVKSRLYACEILLRRDAGTFFGLLGGRAIAALYASALQQRATLELNPWAFLGMVDIGPMGRHLIACGDAAVAALSPLLDDKRSAGSYGGSKEAKLGDADHARICDFAAFFIARVRGLPYRFHREDLAQRDAEIERLKPLLR